MKKRLLIAETALLLASVLIFRGLWLLLDIQPFMNEGPALWISLVLGLVIAVPSTRYIIRNSHK